MGILTLDRGKGEQVVVVDERTGKVVLRTTIKQVSGQKVRTQYYSDRGRFGVWRAEIWEAKQRDEDAK